jgi:hypothetical protein
VRVRLPRAFEIAVSLALNVACTEQHNLHSVRFAVEMVILYYFQKQNVRMRSKGWRCRA